MNLPIFRQATWLKALFIPVCGIGFSYAVLVDRPRQRELVEAQARQQKLVASVERSSHEHEIQRKKLAELKQTPVVAAKPGNLDHADLEYGDLDPGDRASDSNPAVSLDKGPLAVSHYATTSSIARLSNWLEIFEHHGLRCLASHSTDAPTETVDSEISTPQAARRTTPSSNVQTTGSINLLSRKARQTLRVVLQGPFTDMHRALAELQHVEPMGIAIRSLEMEAAPINERSHHWNLTLELTRQDALCP